MPTKNLKSSKAQRGGDTSRSSSQGRKLASGGTTEGKHNKEMDDQTHSPKSAKNDNSTTRRKNG